MLKDKRLPFNNQRYVAAVPSLFTGGTARAARPHIITAAAPGLSYFDYDVGIVHMPDSMTVHSTDAGHATGVLNADGVEFYRMPERVPFGFHPR